MFLKIENRFQESFDQISLHGWILSVSMFISRLFKCVLLVPQLTECAEQKITVKTGPFDYVKLFTPSLFSIIIGGLLFASLILLGGIIFMNLRRKKIQRRLAVIENDLDTQLIEVARTEATGHLGASLAHELKQPIAAILLNAQGAIQVLKRTGLGLPDLEESLKDIVSDVSRLDKIVLGLSGLVLPKKSMEQTLDLNHEIKDVLDLLAGEILKNGVRLVTELTDKAQPLAWKRGELRHMIITLVLNALEKMIGCSQERRVIAIKTEMIHGSIQLSIQDFGDATAVDVLPYLNRYCQAGKVSHSPDHKMGTLSYCAYVVESHEGTIEALSPTGVGCLIRITLPILSAPL